MVGPVRQARAHPLGRRQDGAVAGGLRVSGRAQLVDLRPDQEREAPRPQPRHGRHHKLVYCHEALHLKDKLQKVGYEAKTVKWDSDSDSDESDDKKDLMQ